MSLGLVVNHGNRSKRISDGQYIADLASLFERRQIALGEAHVCEQFEILFTTSEAFRGQLFTLCTAVSHMSEADLSGEELLDLIARALRSQSGVIPESLRARFLAGFEAWNNRGVSGEDEWPPLKKPVATVAEAHFAAPRESQASSLQFPPPNGPTKPDGAPVRPAGVPTLQEALEK